MTINKTSKNFFIIASFMMALAIAIGAFGAHGLKANTDEYLMTIYHTGVEYHFYNTLGLFAVAFLSNFFESKKIKIAGYLLIIGTLIFACSLYLLVLLKASWLGAITPIGGTLMIIAWILVGITLIKELKA